MAEPPNPQLSLPLVDPGGEALGPGTGRHLHQQIFSVFKEYLQPENNKGFTSDVIRTTRRVADLIPLVGNNESMWAEMAGYLGGFINELSGQIPYYHPSQERLVQLRLHLGTCNKIMTEFDYGDGVGKSWCDRTIILDRWREIDDNGGNFPVIGLHGLKPNEEINTRAFQARLMSAGYNMGDLYDVIYDLRNYLEDPVPSRKEATVISCMSMYVIYAGQELFNRIVLNEYIFEEDSDNPNHFKPGELFDGPDLRLGRWRFWQRRFATYEPNGENAEAVNLATRASDLMLAIEKAMTFD